jgi:membrane-bound ClpP family serine protease
MPKKKEDWNCWSCCTSPYACGIFLVVLGAYLIARDLGWIPDIPFWGIVLVILGIFMLSKKNKC